MDRQNWVRTYCLPVSPFPTYVHYTMSAQVVAYLYRPASTCRIKHPSLSKNCLQEYMVPQNLCRGSGDLSTGDLDTGAPCHQVTPLHTACPLPLLRCVCRASADRCVQLCHMRHCRRCEWQRQACHPPCTPYTTTLKHVSMKKKLRVAV